MDDGLGLASLLLITTNQNIPSCFTITATTRKLIDDIRAQLGRGNVLLPKHR